MPLFRALSTLLHRRRTRRRFSSYVDAVLVDQVINNPNFSTPPLHREIDYLLILVKDDDAPEHVQRRLGKIVDAARTSGAFLEAPLASLAVIIFGAWERDASNRTQNRFTVLSQLRQSIGHDARILHGQTSALFGDHGHNDYSHYGSLIPNFSTLLHHLTSLPFGETCEHPVPSSH